MKPVWFSFFPGRRIALVLVPSAVLVFLLPGFVRALYGLDWTDTSYHFQEALNVLHGRYPHADFRTHVGGLSFLVEAWILKIFGAEYAIHRYLGLVISGSIGVLVYATLRLLGMSRGTSLILALVAVVPDLGQQTYFSYGSFSVLLVFCLVFLTVRVTSDTGGRAVAATGAALVLFMLILSKQSYGILVFGAVLALAGVLLIERRPEFAQVSCSLACCAVLVAMVFAWGYFEGWGEHLAYAFANGAEKKGVFSGTLWDTTASAIGVNPDLDGVKYLAFAVVIVAAVHWAHVSNRAPKVVGVFVLCLFAAPLLLHFRAGNPFLVFHVIGLLALGLVALRCIARLGFDRPWISRCVSALPEGDYAWFSAVAVALPVEGAVIAAQLSWPGSAYQDPSVAFLLAVSAVRILGWDTRLKLRRPGLDWMALGALLALGTAAAPQEYRVPARSEGYSIAPSIVPEFAGWPVSEKTYAAITRLRQIKARCGANTLFQLPWAPILYTVLEMPNTTRFDLPYFDTITLKEGREVADSLGHTPPDMLVLEGNLRDMQFIFPALGMKHIYSYLDDDLLPNRYDRMEDVTAFGKNWEVYCRR